MIYPVYVYDAKGKLKKIIQGKDLLTRYWKALEHEFERPKDGVADPMSQIKKGPPRKTYTPICKLQTCRKEFIAFANRQVYCTRAHRQAAWRIKNPPAKVLTRSCQIKGCNNTFETKFSHSKYCSDVCKKKSNILNSRRQRAEEKADIVKRKLESARSKQEILQQQHSPALEGSKAGQIHLVSAI